MAGVESSTEIVASAWMSEGQVCRIRQAYSSSLATTKIINCGESGKEIKDFLVKQRWKSSGHLERLQASGHFRFVKEVGVHQREPGSAERLVDYCRSLDGVNRQLVAGLAETVDALEDLAVELKATIADERFVC